MTPWWWVVVVWATTPLAILSMLAPLCLDVETKVLLFLCSMRYPPVLVANHNGVELHPFYA